LYNVNQLQGKNALVTASSASLLPHFVVVMGQLWWMLAARSVASNV